MNKLYLIGVAIFTVFASCSPSTKITSVWKSESVKPRDYDKVLVLGLMNLPDRTLREKMEQQIVSDLKLRGYNAVRASDEFDPKTFNNMTEEAAIDKLKDLEIDAVLTVVLLDKQKERKYVPGNIYYTPYRQYYNRFWGYRRTLYARIYEPGYYVSNTQYFWESNLYDMATQQLVYSVQTRSFNPDNADNLSQTYSDLIVKDMVKHDVLK